MVCVSVSRNLFYYLLYFLLKFLFFYLETFAGISILFGVWSEVGIVFQMARTQNSVLSSQVCTRVQNSLGNSKCRSHGQVDSLSDTELAVAAAVITDGGAHGAAAPHVG